MESKLAQAQQLPPISKPPILLELEQTRLEIQELRQEIQEIKTAIGTSFTLIRLTAAPRTPEITEALQLSLKASRIALLEQIQKFIHADIVQTMERIIRKEIEARIRTELDILWKVQEKRFNGLSKQIDILPKKIAETIPQTKKRLF